MKKTIKNKILKHTLNTNSYATKELPNILQERDINIPTATLSDYSINRKTGNIDKQVSVGVTYTNPVPKTEQILANFKRKTMNETLKKPTIPHNTQ